ncbi:MAG: formyltransferase family protein, partial [Thermodesulfobacteriota bacterium]
GTVLIENIRRHRPNDQALLICSRRDTIVRAAARIAGLSVELLPAFLEQPMPAIKKILAQEKEINKQYHTWLDRIAQHHPRLGLTIWGWWLPEELFSLPVCGFVNYHPAPLPELRGMEPDTFAILEGRDHIWGTVHRVSRDFDRGDIVKKTPVITIKPWDTPERLWNELTRVGVTALLSSVSRFTSKNAVFLKQEHAKKAASKATLRKAWDESFLDPARDSLITADRRLRAFGGQDIGIRLKISHQGRVWEAADLDCWSGRKRGHPGDFIGLYRGPGAWKSSPVYQCIDGLLVIRLGKKLSSAVLPDGPVRLPECRQTLKILPVKRARRTIARYLP